MVVVFQGQWTKGKTILESYPDVKDGNPGPEIVSKGGGGLLTISYKYVARETERNNQDIKEWVTIARQYPEKWQAEKWARKKADEVTERYFGVLMRRSSGPLATG